MKTEEFQLTFTEMEEWSTPVKNETSLNKAIIWILQNRARGQEATTQDIINYLEKRDLLCLEKYQNPDRVGRLMAGKPYFKCHRKHDPRTGNNKTFWHYDPDNSPYCSSRGHTVDLTLEWINVNRDLKNIQVLINKYPEDQKLKEKLRVLSERNDKLKEKMGCCN